MTDFNKCILVICTVAIVLIITMGCGAGGPAQVETTYTHPATPQDKTLIPLFIAEGQSNIAEYGSSLVRISFVEEFYRLTGIEPKVVNCAVGGTTIQEWQPGGDYFDDCLGYINWYIAQGDHYFAGVLVSIGETNARLAILYQYAEYLINNLKSYRNYYNEPLLPIVMMQLSVKHFMYASNYSWQSIQEQQLQAIGSLENAAIFQPQSWAVLSDHVHHDDASDIRAGKEFAVLMARLMGLVE